MKFDTDFKKAISMLSSEDKDKLIFRLLKKDPVLADQLYFELVSKDTILDRRHRMELKIKKYVEYISDNYYTPGFLLMDVRSLSGEITQHIQTTKDKYGEVSLNLLMLNELLDRNNEQLSISTLKASYTMNIYIIARTFRILVLLKSLHEDYYIEFEEDLKKLGQSIATNPILSEVALSNGLVLNWLISGVIPDNIATIHKNIRARGLLR
ncbi:hypothetical protein D0T84_08000 [Dysgonomonas sp. 521]|uniref:hypothetical protein n=1 Tax=Dysgonomonas sp. 521 TaxID=2302932 RepID=UPI0013D6F1CD|nr:hypothetical protein [Dysgonomonas sp. 521]NDV94858.1 hypothetical protein [Dysgonomonas sp. 521]